MSVDYSAPTCAFDALPTPHTNTTRCFPQYIGGDASDDPERHWFNKYVVTSTTSKDRTGGAADGVTRYEYLDDAAWHYDDDDGLTKQKFKTWSQWRGYGHVRAKTGVQGGSDVLKSQEDSYFLRGMDGDRKEPSGGTKNVSVSLGTGEGDPLADHSSAQGFPYKTVTYSGPGGNTLTKTVNRPWHHETGRKSRDWGTATSNFTGTAQSKTWTSLDDGAGAARRITSTATEHDTVAGRTTQVDDFGDNSTADDNQCTRTAYATNTEANILTLPAREETVAVKCADTPDRTKGVVSDVRTAYDGGAYGAAPAKGDATATATLKKHEGTKATYLEAGATFDDYGRRLTVTDLTADVTVTGAGTPVRTVREDGRTTTTYSPSTGFPAKTTETGPPAKATDLASAQRTVSPLTAHRFIRISTWATVMIVALHRVCRADSPSSTALFWHASGVNSDLVPDDLWERIAPLIPSRPPRRHRFPGRKPVDDRTCLAGIVYVLRKGVSWADVPAERIGCSGVICWRRLRDCRRAHRREQLPRSESATDKVPAAQFRVGDVRRYEFSVMLKDWQAYKAGDPGSVDILFQGKPTNSNPPSFFIAAKRNEIVFRDPGLDLQSPVVADYRPYVGQWLRFRVDVRWADSATGYYKVSAMLPGQKTFELKKAYTRTKTWHPENPTQYGYIKWGLYRPDSTLKNGSVKTRTVQHDDIRISALP